MCGAVLCCAVQVTMGDFEAALEEVQPAFGANTESLQKHVMQVGWQGGKGCMMQRGGGCHTAACRALFEEQVVQHIRKTSSSKAS